MTQHKEKESLHAASVAGLENRHKEEAGRVLQLTQAVSEKTAYISQISRNARVVHNEVVHKFADLIFESVNNRALKEHYQKKAWTLEQQKAQKEEAEKRIEGIRELLTQFHGLFTEAG